MRERRRKKLKELSIDNRTGEERITGRGKNCTPKPHVAPFDFSAQSSELFTCLATVAEVNKEFLQDQKGPRKIRRSEQVVTNPIMESSPPRASTNTSPPEEQHSGFEQESDVEDENQTNDPDYVQPSSRTRKGKKINPDLLQLSERFGFSAEATAHIHNIYSEQKYTTEGVRLSKKWARIEAAIPNFSYLRVIALGFDERKDSSLTNQGDRDREEHCSVVIYSDEGSTIAGHFTPASGSSVDLANGLYQFCQDRKILEMTRLHPVWCLPGIAHYPYLLLKPFPSPGNL